MAKIYAGELSGVASDLKLSALVTGNTYSSSNGTLANSNLVFRGEGGVSVGVSNGSVLISGGGGPGGGGAAIQGSGTYTQGTGTVQFANSNGVTFGLSNNGVMTASVQTNYQSVGAYLTTAAQVSHSHGNPTLNLTNITGTTASNSNGLTLSLSGNAAQTVQPVAYAAGGTTNNFSTLGFVNTNGVSWSTGTGGIQATVKTDYLTTAAQSNHSHGFATTTTNGASIVVGTTNSNGVTIGVPAYLTTAQAPGAYLTTARASNDAIGLNTALTANGVSVTANSSGLSINVPAFLTTAQPVGAYLTTARASNDAIGLNTALTANGLSVTANSSGLSIKPHPKPDQHQRHHRFGL